MDAGSKAAMMNNAGIIKRPCKDIEIDETVTKIVFKGAVSSVKIEDEATEKNYRIIRTKNGMQMIGS